MTDLKEIFDGFKEFVKSNNLEVTDSVIFEKAVDLFIERERTEIIEKRKENITPAQAKFLKNLGYSGDTSKLTKQEASDLISGYKNAQENV